MQGVRIGLGDQSLRLRAGVLKSGGTSGILG